MKRYLDCTEWASSWPLCSKSQSDTHHIALQRPARCCRSTTQLDKALAERTKRIRSNPEIYTPFGPVPEAQEWLAIFTRDALRYPVLLVHAPSYAGKSEWACSLFVRPLYAEIGSSGMWPAALKKLDRSMHDGLVLDDLRDLEFLAQNQEKLQGKYDYFPEFASTPGGQCAFKRDLFAVPLVATVNNSTANLQLLLTDDFLGHEGNRLYIKYPPSQ